MKMDAAEPFNAPVNPIALGIPVSLISCFGFFPGLSIQEQSAYFTAMAIDMQHIWTYMLGENNFFKSFWSGVYAG